MKQGNHPRIYWSEMMETSFIPGKIKMEKFTILKKLIGKLTGLHVSVVKNLLSYLLMQQRLNAYIIIMLNLAPILMCVKNVWLDTVKKISLIFTTIFLYVETIFTAYFLHLKELKTDLITLKMIWKILK